MSPSAGMTERRRRAPLLGLVVAVLLAANIGKAAADPLSEFDRALELAAAQNQLAIDALHDGNLKRAQAELAGLRQAWADIAARKPPQPLASDQSYITLKTDISLRLITADMLSKIGGADGVLKSLDAIAKELAQLRDKLAAKERR